MRYILFVFLFAAFTYPVAAQEGAPEFEVREGVPKEELAVRAWDPEEEAEKIIGYLEPGEAPVYSTGAVFDGEGMYDPRDQKPNTREIYFKGKRGWVLDNILEFNEYPKYPYKKLFCHGAEPFWSFNVTGNVAEYEDFEGEQEFKLKSDRRAASILNVSRHEYIGKNKERVMAVIDYDRSAACTDSMQDKVWDWTIYLLGLGDEDWIYHGCCSLAPQD